MSTINKLSLFSENDANVGAECPDCSRVLKIAKTNLQKSDDGFHLEKPITCICGNVYSDIGLNAVPKDSNPKYAGMTSVETIRQKNVSSATNTGCAYILIFGVFIIGALLIFKGHDSPEEAARKIEVAEKKKTDEKEKAEWLKKSRAAEASIAAARDDGAKALEEFDNAIRENISDRRKALEKAAVEHKTSIGGGAVKADLYTMRDGRIIICTTTVSSTGAIMNCDGEP